MGLNGGASAKFTKLGSGYGLVNGAVLTNIGSFSIPDALGDRIIRVIWNARRTTGASSLQYVYFGIDATATTNTSGAISAVCSGTIEIQTRAEAGATNSNEQYLWLKATVLSGNQTATGTFNVGAAEQFFLNGISEAGSVLEVRWAAYLLG
jgi:hypothetical protein